jgi:hypothetical protein
LVKVVRELLQIEMLVLAVVERAYSFQLDLFQYL